MTDPLTSTSGACPATARSPAQPLVAYVLLWFPLSSETFIFREITRLMQSGLNILVFTLYGPTFKDCSQEMKNYPGPVRRLGIRSAPAIFRAFFSTLWRRPRLVGCLLAEGFFRRMRNLEALAENSWAFFAGFLLAEECQKSGVTLIHASWANGSATAAWIASRISGIPFAFTGRAGDIYPQDGLLCEKSRDAAFIRTNNAANVSWIKNFCPDPEKIHLIYNSLYFNTREAAQRREARPPWKILAVGRLVRTKGFPYLLGAMARLKRENFPVTLTLVGDGPWRRRLERMCQRLRINDVVRMSGFVPNDQMARIMGEHDLLVMPSVIHSNGDRDGIPNVIMEALVCGLPVVATDVCGISEVVQNGKTGYLVQQRDARALATAIRLALENYAETRKLTETGKLRVLEMFDPARNTAALTELYGSVASPCAHDQA